MDVVYRVVHVAYFKFKWYNDIIVRKYVKFSVQLQLDGDIGRINLSKNVSNLLSLF